MAGDVFTNVESRHGGSYAASNSRMVFSNGNLRAAVLLQRGSIGYQQAISRLYEWGTDVVYYIGGRTNGSLNLNRVIGPTSLLSQFYQTYGDVCQAALNHIIMTINNRCGNQNGEPINVTCRYVVVQQLGLDFSTDTLVTNETSSAIFTGLSYNDSGAGASGSGGTATSVGNGNGDGFGPVA